ncbi:hypothetical protein F4820DRAFT_87028 [Hypoxylon rubiginosum]|uniref:Uncharacterized protein n=1 Tax=Hypoxylon rubiginosum TaxID=110542 RepID=A0ACB9YN95_9PEZI|nr:hypothetical protein F4820DRAFT_87028 [Hypoxylon rubiginosum]
MRDSCYNLLPYWRGLIFTFRSPYSLRRRSLATTSLRFALHLNFLFCTIPANRSLGKELVAPRQKGDDEKKKEREKQKQSNYISIYGLGACSYLIDWFPMDTALGCFPACHAHFQVSEGTFLSLHWGIITGKGTRKAGVSEGTRRRNFVCVCVCVAT